jgi:hypothetical protein
MAGQYNEDEVLSDVYDPVTHTLKTSGAALDDANEVLGSVTDAAVVTDENGTVSAKLRGLVKIFGDVWNDTLNALTAVILNSTATVTATIANGASLSGEIDTAGHSQIGLYMPADWTTANLTFQASNVSGGTFYNVYDSAGNELVVTAADDRAIGDIPELAPFRFIKIRSGTSAAAVNQGAARVINVILKN